MTVFCPGVRKGVFRSDSSAKTMLPSTSISTPSHCAKGLSTAGTSLRVAAHRMGAAFCCTARQSSIVTPGTNMFVVIECVNLKTVSQIRHNMFTSCSGCAPRWSVNLRLQKMLVRAPCTASFMPRPKQDFVRQKPVMAGVFSRTARRYRLPALVAEWRHCSSVLATMAKASRVAPVIAGMLCVG